jgi:hypothetical protein
MEDFVSLLIATAAKLVWLRIIQILTDIYQDKQDCRFIGGITYGSQELCPSKACGSIGIATQL